MSGIARLSLEQAPPIDVPFRFFVTAPLFGSLTAILLIGYGPLVLTQRWSPVTLAATHLLTLGYLTMSIFGAMLQMLPVIGGSPVPRVQWVAWGVHPTLTAGILLLAGGFITGNPTLFPLAATILGIAFSLFIGMVGIALIRVPVGNFTTTGMRYALLALIVTVGLGITLLLALGGRLGITYIPLLTNVHLAWGLMGWVGLLVSSVAYQVVPMFQLTPEYPRSMRRLFSAGLFIILVTWSFAYIVDNHARSTLLLAAALFLMLLLYAGVTLDIQRRRRRSRQDPTLRYWQIGMLILWPTAILWGVTRFSSQHLQATELMMGILAIVGVVISLINGMLLKIFAFLSWFHLQYRQMKLMRIDITLPNMKDFIEDRTAWVQQALHFGALALLLAACLEPALSRAAGAAFLAAQIVLLYMLGRAIRLYRHVNRMFLEPPPIPPVAKTNAD